MVEGRMDKHRIEYIAMTLIELRLLAKNEKADFLVYLLEMAATEAKDLSGGKRKL